MTLQIAEEEKVRPGDQSRGDHSQPSVPPGMKSESRPSRKSPAKRISLNPTKLTPGFWGAFLPPFSWMAGLYFLPVCILISYAFMHHEYVTISHRFTLENFKEIAQNSGYRDTLIRTLLLAGAVTLIDALLAFPVAHFLAFDAGKHKQTLMMLVLLPLWSSYLVRVFAWRIILGYNGVLNTILVQLGILHRPSTLFLFNLFSVGLTLCYIWLPFMILPLTTAFERLPKSLLEVSEDLGASAPRTFRKVAFPLILPGLLAGALSVFSLTMGDYITPQLVGGAGDFLAGNLVASQFGVASNWPLGSALAAVVLCVIFLLMALVSRKGGLESL